jgi:hypothetical protein
MTMKNLTKGKLKNSVKGETTAEGTASPPPKISPTTPYELFKKSIVRAQNLLKIHTAVHGKISRPPTYLADIHRAAIVLAVSALDAYIRALVEKRVLMIIKDLTKPIPPSLKKWLKDHLDQDKLLDAAREGDLSSCVGEALKNELESSSFQGIKKIEAAMNLIGIADIFKDVAKSGSMNEQELKNDLGRFTQRRHVIAHCGDYDLTQTPPIENPIKMQDVRDCTKLITKIAEEIEKVLTS